MNRRARIGLLALVVLGLLASAQLGWQRMQSERTQSEATIPGSTPREPARAPAGAKVQSSTDSGETETQPVSPLPGEGGSGRPVQRRPLSAVEAREAMRRATLESECEYRGKPLDAKSLERTESLYWQWMPAEQAAIEREGRLAAHQRIAGACPPMPPAELPSRRRERAGLQAAALEAGDPQARMQDWMQRRAGEIERGQPASPQALADLRAMLMDALLSGDVDLIAGIGRLERHLYFDRPQPDFAGSEIEAWQLVACDLGRDCGPHSQALDRMCLAQTSGACGAADLEAAIRHTSGPAHFRRIQQRRAELLERIRAGRIAGLFDPPTPPPGG